MSMFTKKNTHKAHVREPLKELLVRRRKWSSPVQCLDASVENYFIISIITACENSDST